MVPEVDFRETRSIAIQEASINATVFNLPIPYIEIHVLTWDSVVGPWIEDIHRDQTLILSPTVLFLDSTLLLTTQ